MKFPLLFATLLLLLTGCSVVTKEQCQHHNWYGRGYNDAKKGRPANYGQTYFQACRNQGVYLDLAPWQRGYRKQLKDQCPVSQAKTLATSQPNYHGPCLSLPDFNQAYQQARRDAEAAAHLQGVQNKLDTLRIERSRLLGKQDEASMQRSKELEWQSFQLEQELLELRQPLAVEAEPVNKF